MATPSRLEETPTLSVTTLRTEVQDYMKSCEQLLSPAMFQADQPLSADERRVIEYYQDELKTLLAPTD